MENKAPELRSSTIDFIENEIKGTSKCTLKRITKFLIIIQKSMTWETGGLLYFHWNGKPVEDNNRYRWTTIQSRKTVDDKWVRKDSQKWRSGNPYSNDFLRDVSTSLCVLAYTQKLSFILSDLYQWFHKSILHFAHLLAEFRIGSGRLAYLDAENW